MIILHGDNAVNSRERLAQLIVTATSENKHVIRLEAKKISEAELEALLGENNLFGTQKSIIIEKLHSLPRSKKKNALIALIAAPSDHQIVLWEKRALTKTMLKKFPTAQVEEFKMSNFLFTWLDTLGSNTPNPKKLDLLAKAVQKESEYLCFIMLARHIRFLLLAKTGGKIKGPPFMVAKYTQQAHRFSQSTLLLLHARLVQIDEEAKQSKLIPDLKSQLDLLTIGVYI